MFQYPPFGFSVWYDRHRGGWCWKERSPDWDDPHNVDEQCGYRRRLDAIAGIREELRKRGQRRLAAEANEAHADEPVEEDAEEAS